MTVKTKKKVKKVFKKRGGMRFSMTWNGNTNHDLILEELQVGGSGKLSGETSPFDLIDNYRAMLFFMWGIPLDAPIDKDFLKGAKKVLKKLQKEEPELYEAWKKKKHDARMK